jgi:hypothetical protein
MVPKVQEAFLDVQQYFRLSNCQSGSWKKALGSASEGVVFSTFSTVANSSGGIVYGICVYKQGGTGLYEGYRKVCPTNTYAWKTYYESGGGGGD